MRSEKHVSPLWCGSVESHFRLQVGICAIPVLMWLCAVSADAQDRAPVGTVYAQRQQVAQTRDFVGRVNAIGRVEVQARVKGYLEEVLFKEGDLVKKGDHLYHIEKGEYQAAVEEAKGALERSKAAKSLTAIQLARAEDLLAKSAGTAVARDQALAEDQRPRAIQCLIKPGWIMQTAIWATPTSFLPSQEKSAKRM